MAFLKFSRDKRGVENFYLVQPTPSRRGNGRPRVLYWFRSPPDVKVGREPFDAAVRTALESQNPEIDFDWRAIVETPIPSADADKWRERRRVERAAKYAAAEEELADAAKVEPEAVVIVALATAADDGVTCDGTGGSVVVITPQLEAPMAPADQRSERADANQKRRRRRRGGGQRSRTSAGSGAPALAEPSGD